MNQAPGIGHEVGRALHSILARPWLSFIYISGDGGGSGSSSQGGLEVARMTPQGHTGIGTSWNNTFQPQRTLDVIRQDANPQFRITRERNANVDAGTHADFQVTSAGNLHIRPRSNGNTRAVAIGFLPGDLDEPINAINARLDVGGRARIRTISQAENPNCLIVGNNVLNGNNQVPFSMMHLGYATPGGLQCLWMNVKSIRTHIN